jgi:hypothetical protein
MERVISNNRHLCSQLGPVIRSFVSKYFPKKITLLLSISALFFGGAVNPIYAQQPSAFTRAVQPVELVEWLIPEPIDIQSIRVEDELREQQGGPYRFAIPRRVVITPDANGMWEEIDNETWLWRIHITSPGATSISLGFTRYLMPPGGSLFIYSADGTQVIGPYTEHDNAAHGQLWTPLIHSDDIVVELTIPAAEVANLELTLGSINHGYRRMLSSLSMEKALGDSDWCEINVACTAGDGWRDQIRSVAHYHVTLADGTFSCTGTLINNTAGNDKYYFLTAFHCFDEYNDGVLANPNGAATSMVVYWNFQASTCGGITGPENQTQTGAYFRAAYCRSDFTLVELDEMPLPAFGIYYAGWDRNISAPSSGVAIHHPQGDLKKISVETHALTSSTGVSASPCITADLTHFKVSHWEVGTTEGGSSGCAFFNPSKRVVGQLSGGIANCDTGGYDKFGRFNVSWTGGGTDATRLSNWLDPTPTGQTTLDGKDPSPCARSCGSCEPEDTYLGTIGTVPWYSISGNCGNCGKWVGQFVGEAGATYHFDLCPDSPGSGTANFDADIKITNSSCTILAGQDGYCISSSYLPNDFPWTCQTNGTYYVVIAPYNSYNSHTCNGTASNTFTLKYYKAVPPPPNDMFANAIAISDTNGQTPGSNVGATKEAGEPNHAGNSGGKSVWWKWTAPSNGQMTIDTFGSSFNTLLAVYTGNSVGDLNSIASNDDSGGGAQSQVTFPAVSGTTYRIAVDGYSGATGNITLHWSLIYCMKPSAPEYATWVSYGKPDCWCYCRQCRGDIDGKSDFIGKPVVLDDLTIFKSAYGKTLEEVLAIPGAICADLDHKSDFLGKPVVLDDLTIFKTYYGQPVTLVPYCDQPPIYTGPYNYWTAP